MTAAAHLQDAWPGEPSITARCAARPDRGCELRNLGEFRDQSGRGAAVEVHRCAWCGVGVSRPPLPDVAFLYEDRSSQDFQQKSVGLVRAIKTLAFGREAKRLLAQSPARPRRVLDYGCGGGLFTRCLQAALGSEGRVIGADFHRTPPADLGEVQYRPMAELAHCEAADLLIAMHVLEHDDDPQRLLEAMSRLVAPGGYLIIETPNIDCVWASVFGRFWDAWYLPYHRVHFSRRSLRALIEAGDLTVVREIDVSVPTMGRTAANLLGRSNGLAFVLLGALLHPIQWAVESALRRPSGLRIVARKPPAADPR